LAAIKTRPSDLQDLEYFGANPVMYNKHKETYMFISITDTKNKPFIKEESFLQNRYRVISRSGLSVTEIQFFEVLKGLISPKRILFLENRTGVCGIIARSLYPEAEITIHCIDLYYANKIKKNLAKNGSPTIEVVCKPYIEQKDFYDTIFLQFSKSTITRELASDLLQQTHQALQPAGKCFLSIEGNDTWVHKQAEKLFGGYSVLLQNRTGCCLGAQKRGKLKRARNFQAECIATIFGKKAVRLITIPGIFSHREVDEGALALAEIASGDASPGDTVFDMGCGCGVVGISIAVNQHINNVCFVDSNSRATYVTEKNCLLNNLEHYEVRLSDQGVEEDGNFSLFTGNPPYFSHYKISELFICTAHKVLKQGGRAFIVAKTASWHYTFMKNVFGNAERIRRRGYEIVKSVKYS